MRCMRVNIAAGMRHRSTDFGKAKTNVSVLGNQCALWDGCRQGGLGKQSKSVLPAWFCPHRQRVLQPQSVTGV